MNAGLRETFGAVRGSAERLDGNARGIYLNRGLYAFTVEPLSGEGRIAADIVAPLTQICRTPAANQSWIEIVSPQGEPENWLGAGGGTLFVKVRDDGGSVFVVSYGVPANSLYDTERAANQEQLAAARQVGKALAAALRGDGALAEGAPMASGVVRNRRSRFRWRWWRREAEL
jgi:hypothetical protein